ncbi:MAG: hypothetical protein AAF208_03435, partial [Cyanobacteria bacterium P01_A01_bin.45]
LPGWSAYCASKAGAKMLTEAVHAEYGDTLRVMGLSPFADFWLEILDVDITYYTRTLLTPLEIL